MGKEESTASIKVAYLNYTLMKKAASVYALKLK